MKLFIIAQKQKDFTGRDQTKIPYYWYTARTENGARIQFGSKVGTHKIGETLELNVDKFVKADDSTGWKEYED